MLSYQEEKGRVENKCVTPVSHQQMHPDRNGTPHRILRVKGVYNHTPGKALTPLRCRNFSSG